MNIKYKDNDGFVIYHNGGKVNVEPDINSLAHQIEEWGRKRGILESSDPKTQALKTISEIGEFADNVAKGRDCRDDIGDIVVTLVLQCALQGYSFAECIQLAYDEIAGRKGKMVNGIFVKEGDNCE